MSNGPLGDARQIVSPQTSELVACQGFPSENKCKGQKACDLLLNGVGQDDMLRCPICCSLGEREPEERLMT